jgi:hypothetical protein
MLGCRQLSDTRIAAVAAQPAGFSKLGGGMLGRLAETMGGSEIGVRLYELRVIGSGGGIVARWL